MTFKIELSRPPLKVTFEAPSIDEAATVLTDNGDRLAEMFGIPALSHVAGLSDNDDAPEEAEQQTTDAAPATAPAAAKRRGRPAKNAEAASAAPAAAPPVPSTAPTTPPAPVVANAPAPIPVPPVATAAPAATPPDTTPNANGIPNFLDRTGNAAPPPVPPAVAPPVVPPAAPVPGGVLAQKIVADLKRRAAGSPDQGKGLVDWLAGPGIGLVVAGASFDEACAVINMTTDDKLQSVAGLLGVAS